MHHDKNQVSLVGTLSEDPIIKLKSNQRMSRATVTLLTSRNTDNSAGHSSFAFFEWIPVHFHGQLAHRFSQQRFCKGDKLSIQGELRAYDSDDEKGRIKIYL